MVIDMNEAKLTTLEQVRAFLAGTAEVGFCVPEVGEDGRYAHIAAVLSRFGYQRLKKPDKGLILRYLGRTTGYSRQQVTRLVKRWSHGKGLRKAYRKPEHGWKRRFTDLDVALLAETDALHNTLSGPATVHLMKRALEGYGDTRYARLARISVGQPLQPASTLWLPCPAPGLHQDPADGNCHRSAPGAGARRPSWLHPHRQRASGRPGWRQGGHHINAVDCVTQWELVATCEKITEAYLLPVIEALLDAFPFRILGFHADNGSEYINHKVARMLDKLAAEFTRSRPRHSNDNGLAETKNGAIIRKHLGYSHIPQRFAAQINAFCAEHLNPYLNFHRPCLFAEEYLDPKGKTRKRYPLKAVMTPLEKLASLPKPETFLKPGVTLDALREKGRALSDNEAATRLNEARTRLFQFINKRSRNAA